MSDEAQGAGNTDDPMRPVKLTGGFFIEYRYYVLAVLTLIYVVNWIDRYVFAILLQPIKEELGVNDTVMGLLTGTAFGLFYATMGIPLALMADRTTRKKLIAWCLGLFSVMTALCGVAMNAWQFAILRIGVGVGEAGTSPSSHSMIADLFAPKERATAMAIFAVGLNIGIFIAFFAGGWILELFGWRWAFVLAGAPGIALVSVLTFHMREPPRGHADGFTATSEHVPLAKTFAHLWGLKTFRHLSIAAALNSFVGYGALQWVPAYLARSHQMSYGEIGTVLAFIIGIAGGIGTFAGGILVDKLSKGDARWNVWLPAGAILIGTPFAIAFYLAGSAFVPVSTGVGLWLWVLPVAASALYLGPALSVTQGLATLKMRAMASAILLFIINIIGLGLGPAAIGMLSDYFLVGMCQLDACTLVQEGTALRWALVVGAIVNVWAMVHFMLASRSIRGDLNNVAEQERQLAL
jgi:predicted MFS family arabinose efflux permease